eukprot:11351759-Heterocapsa_arctica.AAC.1
MGQSPYTNKATAAGVSYDDWYGNYHADKQAKAGAGKHGYTNGQQLAIEQKLAWLLEPSII